ncbi:Endonuclease/exonuclease/phosphatase [Ephemerocybe angulata]|uniref:Endonuclease/exonuclease/phosphatase n=1 Tax=Ephemerocybe angulata TaxID=980116 RepID=A0A8H6I8D7_9AGAR|nr:Endonuclease/exonuclease/phosphatase [Tulosesus angulatus]
MRDNQIGIMAVQETHLTKSETTRLNGVFEKRMLIINSAHGRKNTAGVAIVLNKQWTAWNEALHWDILPGRALLVQIPWKNSKGAKRTILAIYAPNTATHNKRLWVDLQAIFKKDDIPKPDIMLGDFNIVEDALDRIPAREDDEDAVEELRNLKSQLNLIDGWRRENGEEKVFTFYQSSTFSQSRIDRIYITNDLYASTRSWSIDHDASLSDHNLVSVQYFDPGAPEIGKGRWTIPHYALEDDNFTKQLIPELKTALEKAMFGTRSDTRNPQTDLKKMKENFIHIAKDYVQTKVPHMKMQIAKRESDLRKTLAHPEGENPL